MIQTRSRGGHRTNAHCYTVTHSHTGSCTALSWPRHKHFRLSFQEAPAAHRKEQEEDSEQKSAWPHQIFTQEQLYCRNITHRSCAVIRSIFSAPLCSVLPPPPWAAEMRLGSGPMPLAAECYTCAQNPTRHKMAARQASPPEMSTAVCICRVCMARVRTLILWGISVRVCKCLWVRTVHQCPTTSFPKYVRAMWLI